MIFFQQNIVTNTFHWLNMIDYPLFFCLVSSSLIECPIPASPFHKKKTENKTIVYVLRHETFPFHLQHSFIYFALALFFFRFINYRKNNTFAIIAQKKICYFSFFNSFYFSFFCLQLFSLIIV